MKPYIQATAQLTEEDLSSEPKWYAKMKRKEKRVLIESKANERTSFNDEVCGMLNPIVYALNKGKNIVPNSVEHRYLRELLQKANGI